MSSVKRTRDLSRITSLHKIDTTDPIWDVEKYKIPYSSQQLRSDAEANSRLKEEIVTSILFRPSSHMLTILYKLM